MISLTSKTVFSERVSVRAAKYQTVSILNTTRKVPTKTDYSTCDKSRVCCNVLVLNQFMSYKISDKNGDKDIINYVPGHVSVLGQFTNLSEKTMLG